MKPLKIISGGQTRADQGALLGARAVGIETGGMAPKGYKTEDGPAPWLADYGLEEHESEKYPPRTEWNVIHSDATVLFGNISSRGSRLTLKLCEKYGKPVHHIDLTGEMRDQAKALRLFVKERRIWVLSVAGNRESKNPGIRGYVRTLVAMTFGRQARLSQGAKSEIVLFEHPTEGPAFYLHTGKRSHVVLRFVESDWPDIVYLDEVTP